MSPLVSATMAAPWATASSAWIVSASPLNAAAWRGVLPFPSLAIAVLGAASRSACTAELCPLQGDPHEVAGTLSAEAAAEALKTGADHPLRRNDNLGFAPSSSGPRGPTAPNPSARPRSRHSQHALIQRPIADPVLQASLRPAAAPKPRPEAPRFHHHRRGACLLSLTA